MAGTTKKSGDAKRSDSATTMSSNQKLALLRSITVLLDAVARAASTARREGWIEEADLLDHWFEKLDTEIDRLRANVLRTWVGDVEALRGEIDENSNDIEEAIADLKKSQKTAQAAIKIAGYVDDAIKIALKLFV